MTLHSIIEQFDVLMDAPDSVSKLRKFILQLAVQGKLTKQDPSDEPAEVLLERIQAEKGRLYEAGEIRKPKTFDPVGTDDELFSLPSNWVWTRLGEIRRGWGQKEPSRRFSYIDVSSINKEDGIISDEFEEIAPEDAPSRARKVVRPGTVLYSSVRPYLLNIAIVDREFDPQPIASTAFMIMHPLGGLSERYLYYYLRSKPLSEYVGQQMVGMAYPAVSKTKFMPAPFPLPPLEEQQRIVATVDRLMEECDTLEAQQEAAARVRVRCTEAATHALQTADTPAAVRTAWHRLRDHFATLTATPAAVDAVRQTILQLAVQGKLTEQDPNDEFVSQWLDRRKKRPEFDDLPSLPAGWSWMALEEVFSNLRNGYSKAPRADRGVPVLRISAVRPMEVDRSKVRYLRERPDDFDKYVARPGDILFIRYNGNASLVGACAVVPNSLESVGHPDKLIRGEVKYPELTLPRFLEIALNAGPSREYINSKSKTTAGNYGISQTDLRPTPIPIPHSKEQHRIVATVDRLMDECDTLEAKLEQEGTLGGELLEAMLHGGAHIGEPIAEAVIEY